MGHVCYEQRKYEEAEKYLLKAIEMAEIYADRDSIIYMQTVSYPINSIACVYLDNDDIDKAKESFSKMIAYRRELSRSDSTYLNDYASGLSTYGRLYITINQPEKAIGILRESYNIRRKLVDINSYEYSTSLANTLNKIGYCYADLGRYDSAEFYYRKAIDIFEIQAKENPEYGKEYYIITLNNIGSANNKLGNNEKAEMYYARAIEICKEAARNNPEAYNEYCATILNNLGTFYNKQKDYDKALKYHQEAYAMRKDLVKYSERFLVSVTYSCYNIGKVYENMKDLEKAEACYVTAYNEIKAYAASKPEVYNPNFAKITHNLGLFYKNQHKKFKARKYFNEAIDIYQELEDKNPGKYADIIQGVKTDKKSK